MKFFITSTVAPTYLPHLKVKDITRRVLERNTENGLKFQWEKVCSSRVITVLDWLKISGSAVDRVFELVSSEIVGFTVVVALIQNNLWEKIFVH
ncbi:hypothetical protein Bca4012_093046 [Brassica carinata]